MKTTTLRLISAIAATFVATVSAHSQNLIVNGGFEDGTYSTTIVGPTFGNLTFNVPNGWTASIGFAFGDGVVTFNPFSGSDALAIGNQSGPTAVLSQTFTDTPGVTYWVNFYLGNIQAEPGIFPPGFFSASIDGNVGFSLVPTSSSGSYIKEGFSFIGTGLDTFLIAAQNDIAEFEVDNVSVTAQLHGVPGPTAGAGIQAYSSLDS